jgi:hypothetical protein
MLVVLCAGSLAWGFDEPAGLLERFFSRIKNDLERLPDYVCTQSIERFGRPESERAWEKIDALRFEVALVAGRELYGLPGGRRFQDRPLAELARRGTIGTGQFALLAKHLFLTSTAQVTYRGENTEERRTTHEYSFDVPADRSSYKLRAGTAEATVGFQGVFAIDADTLDLIRLDAQAYDIPEKLGLAQVDTALHYSRLNIEGDQLLLPLAGTLTVVAVDGEESLNRTRLSSCRHYTAESTIRFDTEIAPQPTEPASTKSDASTPVDPMLPHGALVELTLDASLNPGMMGIGDHISASVSRVVRDGDRVAIPPGAVVHGHLVRLEKQSMPFPIYEIGLEFDTLETEGHTIPFTATMVEAGPAAGLIQQTKRLDPSFTPRGKSRMDILVREFQRGQGILHWDARRGAILRGLRMKWRVESKPAM